MLSGEDRHTSGVFWPIILDEMVSTRLSKGLCLKNKVVHDGKALLLKTIPLLIEHGEVELVRN